MTVPGRAGSRLTLLLLSVLATPLCASPPPQGPPGSELTVSVLTMGVGPAIWERFGHNAIVIEDRRLGTSVAYNYGMFSFRQENFLLRFLQGRMLYWMGAYPTTDDVKRYAAAGRAVWRQELRLEPSARLALRDFLEWNAEPAHAYYRYDYYRDNCSTRIRDAIDRATSGALRAQTTGPGSGTYRFHTLRLNSHNPPLFAGLDLVLGQGADGPATKWDEMFLPLLLREYLREVRVADSAGRLVPLVVREDTLVGHSRFTAPVAPPRWWPWFLALGVAVGSACWWGGAGAVGSRLARRTFAVVGTGWALLTGVAGAILAGLWGLTDHAIAARNENALQCTVIALALGVVLPIALRRPDGWSRAARTLAYLVGGVSLAGLLLKLAPGFQQANLEVLAFTVPANLGMTLGVGSWARALRQ